MKNLKLSVILFAFTFAFCACKKDRTCKCITSKAGSTTSVPANPNADTKTSKKDQKKYCEDIGNQYGTTCTLED